jgi:hypothetical protein
MKSASGVRTIHLRFHDGLPKIDVFSEGCHISQASRSIISTKGFRFLSGLQTKLYGI